MRPSFCSVIYGLSVLLVEVCGTYDPAQIVAQTYAQRRNGARPQFAPQRTLNPAGKFNGQIASWIRFSSDFAVGYFCSVLFAAFYLFFNDALARYA